MAVERALLSVYDKTGILELAHTLAGAGVELLSTGGTAAHLAAAGIAVTSISEWTAAPEILGGRVKTLHPKVFGGILAKRNDPQHASDCAAAGIGPIDLVVVNLYPFEETIARAGVTLPEAIEQIDIGGPSMLRAAAKNHNDVVVLAEPAMYARFIEEFRGGEISQQFRREAAARVFARTAEYDRAIATYLAPPDTSPAAVQVSNAAGADTFTLDLRKQQDLRYGENPQQTAGFYVRGSSNAPFEQLQGKELSFNNLLDLDSAWRIASAFDEPVAVVIKHTNPCGVASGRDAAEAVKRAIEADPVSAFGGIVGSNREISADAAEHLSKLFLEVIVAPSFSTEASALLKGKKNLRLVRMTASPPQLDLRTSAGGFLVQSSDRISPATGWRVMTSTVPDETTMQALEFAWKVCAFVKSNAIVIAGAGQTIGIGAGQMSRVDAARIAIMKSVRPTSHSVAASDAFFPFRDGLDILIDAGVNAVIQPGGSVRDEEVVAAADERGIAMVFTGERHFRH